MERFRTIIATNTPTTVSSTAAQLLGYSIYNRHSAAIFIKFYNVGAPTFQDTPIFTVAIPATSAVIERVTNDPIESFGVAMGIRVVTGAADNDNTAAGSLPLIELRYK